MSVMALAGIKKQLNKANQYVSEKMGGAEGTKLDEQFTEMERKTDVTNELVEELQVKTKEFLHPNPTSRAKMAAVKGISKLSGQAKASTYPQPEGVLGDCMTSLGRKLGDDEVFGQALIETGEAMKQIADIKYALDDNVKQNFLEPLHYLQTKDLKEVMHHRKKLQGRRLDFDCKKRKKERGTHIGDDEIKMAEDKFDESLHLAQMGMHNLLQNNTEQISQLATFSESLLDYHRQCTEILSLLHETLQQKIQEAASQSHQEFRPRTLTDLGIQMKGQATVPAASGGGAEAGKNSAGDSNNGVLVPVSDSTPQHSLAVTPEPGGSGAGWEASFTPGAKSPAASPLASPMRSPSRATAASTGAGKPSAKALFDFEPENPGELEFKEGDIITLTQRIDDNWIGGAVRGRTGYFPISYVKILVPLPG